jgi:hypothetical protein
MAVAAVPMADIKIKIVRATSVTAEAEEEKEEKVTE